MPSLEEVRTQIQSLEHGDRLLAFREIRELPNILSEDERIEKMVQGFYNNSQGVLVATNKRVMFVDKGLIYGVRVEDFAYNQITSIEYKTGMMFGTITIYAPGNRAVISQLVKGLTKDFGDYVRARIPGAVPHASAAVPTTQHAAPPDDFITQLERLADLKERGVLTEEEFTAQKKRILGS